MPPMSAGATHAQRAPVARAWALLAELAPHARAALEGRARDGNAVAAAVAGLGPAWAELEGLVEADAGEASALPPVQSDVFAQTLYDAAAESVAEGRINRAVAILASLLHAHPGEADALVGLAVCAARLSAWDAALLLANECIDLSAKHPRAYYVAGFCELSRGNRKAAQSYLAMAARMARRRPEFRDDLRTAQRLLLILHYAE